METHVKKAIDYWDKELEVLYSECKRFLSWNRVHPEDFDKLDILLCDNCF